VKWLVVYEVITEGLYWLMWALLLAAGAILGTWIYEFISLIVEWL
jgi:hypothetical protein